MALKLIRLSAIKLTPSSSAETFDALTSGTIVFGTGKTATEENGPAWVNIFIPPGVLDGWILADNAKDVPDPALPPLDPESFVRQCTLVDRSMNSDPKIGSWFVTADFLIARALFETDMTVRQFSLPRLTGPFGLQEAEWDAFLNSGLSAASNYHKDDKIYFSVQVYAAACRMHTDSKAISALFPSTTGASNETYVPSYLDLFHAYLTDPQIAAEIKRKELDSTALVSTTLGVHLDSVKAHPQFDTLKSSMTVPQFVAATEEVLANLLNSAFDKIKTFAGDELPRPTNSVAPWFDVAIGEMQAGITEAGHPERVKSYFDSTDHGSVTGAIPAWCGAFAAFCVKQAGFVPPKGAAAAANWKRWGTTSIPLGSHDIPAGAVVTLTASDDTNAIGHVGFFTQFAQNGDVILLGGNQTRSVRETPFAVTRIASIRTFETLIPVGAANRFDMTAAHVEKRFQQYGDLIIDRFERAGITKRQQLVAALANAIAESGLDPSIKSVGEEESYGLFQCNRTAGLGKGYSVEDLKNPEINIAIIIQEARKYSAYTAASSIEMAVDAFVRFVERPKKTNSAIKERIKIANDLL